MAVPYGSMDDFVVARHLATFRRFAKRFATASGRNAVFM